MIDTTNILADGHQAVQTVQTTLSAWNVVALGLGAFLTHLYHTVVNGGGLKNIAKQFWSGVPPAPASDPKELGKQL